MSRKQTKLLANTAFRAPIAKSTTRLVAKQNTKSSATKLAPKQFAQMPAQTGGQRHEKQIKHIGSKEYDPDLANNSLKKKSPWYASLRDPVQGGGAKIPDTVGINTATMQLIQKVSVAVNAAGVAGLEIITPYINSSTNSNYVTSAPASTPIALTWSATQAFSNKASMQSVAQSHRVVSAAVYGEYEGTTLQDSGDVTAYVRPYVINALTTVNTIQALYGSSVLPINKARSRPMCSRWFPVNYNSQSYKDFIAPNFSSFGAGAAPFWTLGMIYQGLPAGVGSVVFTIAVNYEFVPSLNTIDFITPDASPIDPIEEQMVQQWIQEDSQTGISSNKMVDVQPGSQVVEAASQGINADNGFGMLGSIIKELAPVVLPMLL